MAAGRTALEHSIARIESGDFPPAPPERRDWALCRGCPALGNLCSGPNHPEAEGEPAAAELA
jgi:hypothetical protein